MRSESLAGGLGEDYRKTIVLRIRLVDRSLFVRFIHRNLLSSSLRNLQERRDAQLTESIILENIGNLGR